MSMVEAVSDQFLMKFYTLFDKKDTRKDLGDLYHPTSSRLTFNSGHQSIMGKDGIVEYYTGMPIGDITRKKLYRAFQGIDDKSVIISVIGEITHNSDPYRVAMACIQVFMLKEEGGTFLIFNDMLNIFTAKLDH